MTTWLHEQRLAAVHDTIRASNASTVLDLGCGDGDLLIRLAQEPQIDRIVGLDLCHNALRRLRARLSAIKGEAPVRVDLVHGSLTECNAALAGFDCAVLIETIEHIGPEHLSLLERSVFGVTRPRTVVLTTPNTDFNWLLGVRVDRFRHSDHRFEWGREKFRRWAQGVAERNGYGVACSDIAGSHPVHGGASQMAVFKMVGPPSVPGLSDRVRGIAAPGLRRSGRECDEDPRSDDCVPGP